MKPFPRGEQSLPETIESPRAETRDRELSTPETPSVLEGTREGCFLAKERPILFSGAMVRAILEGRKTQTRRIVKPQPIDWCGDTPIICGHYHPVRVLRDGEAVPGPLQFGFGDDSQDFKCPYGQPGDRLTVKETFRVWKDEDSLLEGPIADADYNRKAWIKSLVEYRADSHNPEDSGWRPSIFMPLWLSRLTLEITGVRVERLDEISEADAIAEGVQELFNCSSGQQSPREVYAALWNSINGPGSWESNPWVWVISFRKLEGGRP